MTSIKLQKYLSEQQILSRRKAETAILEGLIKVNGKTATLGMRVDPSRDKVEISPIIYEEKRKFCYMVFHKPPGVVTNLPQEGETQITDLLPAKYQKLNSVGRLDKDSEGLILLTDDGIFAKKLLNNDAPHVREYLVWVNEPMTSSMARTLEKGVVILATYTKPTKVTLLGEKYFKINLYEGKNRQIRRMVQTLGLFVVRLKRIRFGSILLGDIPRGQYRLLSNKEVMQALEQSRD
jgi:23S rRNA pseudouridine2604 synthase